MTDLSTGAATPLFGVPISGPMSRPVSMPTTVSKPTLPPMRKPKRHGILDDTLGFLGDFLMSRLRMGTPYRDAKQNEKLQIASEGFEQNPEEGFKRLAEVDFGAATKLREQYIDNQRLAAQAASTAEAREARTQQAEEAQRNKNRSIVASFMGSLSGVAEKDRPANYAGLRSKMLTTYGRNDPELSTLLPETFDPTSVDAFLDGHVPVGTQRQQRLVKERMETQAEQFDKADKTKRDLAAIVSGDKAASRSVTIKGQQRASADKAASRAVTIRGQNKASADRAANRAVTIRGQNIRGSIPKKGQVVTMPDGTKRVIQ